MNNKRKTNNKSDSLFLIFIALYSIVSSSNGEPDNSNEDVKKLALANNNLGLNLYHLLAKGNQGNVFFSPFSLSNAFGMLFAGSEGNTAKQLRSALGYNAADLMSSEIPSAFNEYLNLIVPEDQSPNPEYVLNLANELLLAMDFEVYPEYKTQVRDLFHAYIKEVDFEKNAAQIVNEVNNWVNEQTHGKISQLLSNLSPSTVLLILNAIYFKGTWKVEFEKKMTQNDNFYNDGQDSNAKKVPLMHLKTKFPYTSLGDLQALELPYKGDNISMIVLLPKQRDGLTKLEDNITPESIRNIMKQMYEVEVEVTFPKFKVEYKRTMNSDFKSLGATDIFDPSSANFAGITPNKGVYVSEVIHKAAIEVNEEGSEAAAATAIGMRTLALPVKPPPIIEFMADHPFMFAIVDKRNDMILFLGRITEL